MDDEELTAALKDAHRKCARTTAADKAAKAERRRLVRLALEIGRERKAAGQPAWWTQYRIAEVLGVKGPTVTAILKPRRTPE